MRPPRWRRSSWALDRDLLVTRLTASVSVNTMSQRLSWWTPSRSCRRTGPWRWRRTRTRLSWWWIFVQIYKCESEKYQPLLGRTHLSIMSWHDLTNCWHQQNITNFLFIMEALKIKFFIFQRNFLRKCQKMHKCILWRLPFVKYLSTYLELHQLSDSVND